MPRTLTPWTFATISTAEKRAGLPGRSFGSEKPLPEALTG